MTPDVKEGVSVYTYSRDEGDFHAENIIINNGEITFDLVSPVEKVTGISLGQPIPINIDNAVKQYRRCIRRCSHGCNGHGSVVRMHRRRTA